MTKVQKNAIIQAILKEKIRLGSANKVATRCKVSSATISQMINENWELIKPEMWQKVAQTLDVNFTGWQIAETINYKMILNTLNDAKNESMFMAISEKAGSGKTATLKTYAESNNANEVFYIQAREWAKREFLINLCQNLGIDTGRGYVSVDKLTNKIISFFNDRIFDKPLLIIDEADKLKPSAIHFLIPLYNELEDKLAVVIAGTENLKKEIKAGVKYNKKGYDEIDSRFGRNYINLIGATKQDISAICLANSITDKNTQRHIFKECSPVKKLLNGHNFEVVEDMRRVKRIIKRELIKLKNYA